METPILSGSHLNVTLGNHKILNDVSVSFQAGVMHAILGPNGSGKSTMMILMKILLFAEGFSNPGWMGWRENIKEMAIPLQSERHVAKLR